MAHLDVCRIDLDQRVRPKLEAPDKRIGSFAEAEPTFTLEEAVQEAKRCAHANPCHYCEVCQLLCPDLSMIRDPKTGHIVIDLDYCKGCGLCAHFCPHGAITMVIDED